MQSLKLARQVLYHLSHSTRSFFVLGIFKIRSHFCGLGWPQTSIFLISVSWVARISGMSHGYLAKDWLFFFFDDTRVWSQGLTLARQPLYHVNHKYWFLTQCFTLSKALSSIVFWNWSKTIVASDFSFN
jgi:hypothetical protein